MGPKVLNTWKIRLKKRIVATEINANYLFIKVLHGYVRY